MRGVIDPDPRGAAAPGRNPGEIVRLLTAGEAREARWMFGANINLATVRIHRGRYFPFQPERRAMAPDGEVYFPPAVYQVDFSSDALGMSTLIHELTHVWQTQSGVWLKFRRIFVDGGDYEYGTLPADADLKSFKVEEQAAIVEDWYRLRHGLPVRFGNGAIEAYEAVIRAAIPRGKP